MTKNQNTQKKLVVNSTQIDPSTDNETQLGLAKFELIYSITGLVLGLCCIAAGVVLFLKGITGSTSWTAKALGLESTISDAAPGAIVFIVGLFVVMVTRYKFSHKKTEK